MNTINPLIERPVYEFRPLPDYFRGEFRRYADGAWLPDDGEYDVAFIGQARSENFTYPACLFVEHSYQKNIIASWTTGHWSAQEKRRPCGNAWHYALKDGETEWGGDWKRDRHLNAKAGSSGMNKMCSENGGSNGAYVDLNNPKDLHIAADLLRDRETKEVFKFPEHLECMYCGDMYCVAPSTN